MRGKNWDESIRALKELGTVRTKPVYELQTWTYAVTQAQFDAAENGFHALMEYYNIPNIHATLIANALSYMYFWKHSTTISTRRLNDSIIDKIRWQ